VPEQRLKASEYLRIAIALQPYAVNKIASGKVQIVLADGFALMAQKVFGLIAEQTGNITDRHTC
jgi:hypothetical protein